MADPIGILTSALSVAQKVYNIAQTIKDAPNGIKALEKETGRVRDLLAGILVPGTAMASAVFQNMDAANSQVKVLVHDGEELTTAVEKFLGKATKQRADGTHKVKKLRWPLYAAEADQLAERFRAFYTSLVAVCVASNSAKLDTLLLSHYTLLSNQREQHAALTCQDTTLRAIQTSLEVTLRRAAHEQRQGRSHAFDDICAMNARLSMLETWVAPSSSGSAAVLDGEEIDSDDGRTATHAGFHARTSRTVSVATTPVSPTSPRIKRDCADDCICSCHSRPARDLQLIPTPFRPWLGHLNVPRTLVASVFPAFDPCDDVRCRTNRTKAQTVRYYPPAGFAHIEASIRFEAFPVHFCIQTPRIVPSLTYLGHISFEVFRMKLSTRELTLQDVESDGISVLHQLLWREQEKGDAFDLIRYALNTGVPRDWQYLNMTAVECTVHNVQRYPEFRPGAQSLDLTVVKPLLHDSLNETSQTLNAKLRQSDLITFLLQPDRDVEEALGHLRSMLTLPTMSAQMHQPDASDWLPIDYATCAFPEAVEVLLQAGASTKHGSCLLHLATRDQWKAVSALIRTGYPVNERDTNGYGRSPLHDVAAALQLSYRNALELVRHGGHLLDWDARDDRSATPFELADYFANKRPENEQLQRIRELYRTQCIPFHAQYISSFDGERLMDAKEAATFPRISLIDTALSGDVESIGRLISAGAMVNERDEDGRTLLHLIAMGDRVPNTYRVALELVRHGGRQGVDWIAKTAAGQTALEIVQEVLGRDELDERIGMELGRVRELLESRRLPPGETHASPCTDPLFCRKCESLRCICIENDVPGMPGSFVN